MLSVNVAPISSQPVVRKRALSIKAIRTPIYAGLILRSDAAKANPSK